MEKIIITCDIENKEHSNNISKHKVSVMTYNPRDGRRAEDICDPYFLIHELDICDKCFKEIADKKKMIYSYYEEYGNKDKYHI